MHPLGFFFAESHKNSLTISGTLINRKGLQLSAANLVKICVHVGDVRPSHGLCTHLEATYASGVPLHNSSCPRSWSRVYSVRVVSPEKLVFQQADTNSTRWVPGGRNSKPLRNSARKSFDEPTACRAPASKPRLVARMAQQFSIKQNFAGGGLTWSRFGGHDLQCDVHHPSLGPAAPGPMELVPKPWPIGVK